MPFKDKARNLFRSKTSDTLSKTSTNGSTRDDVPDNVYKPGEPMPPPKYRRTPEKKHKEKLEAFSFADAWRRKSFQSSHSPMGTRAPSRRASLFSSGRKSLGRKSMTSEAGSDAPEEGQSKQKKSVANAEHPNLSPKREQDGGDDDVANVGLSKAQSKDMPVNGNLPNGQRPTLNTAHDHHPFTEEDLNMAMQRSRLEVLAQ